MLNPIISRDEPRSSLISSVAVGIGARNAQLSCSAHRRHMRAVEHVEDVLAIGYEVAPDVKVVVNICTMSQRPS